MLTQLVMALAMDSTNYSCIFCLEKVNLLMPPIIHKIPSIFIIKPILLVINFIIKAIQHEIIK